MPKESDIHEEALERFTQAEDHYRDDNQRGDEDAAFVFGDQWPEKMRVAREAEDRPCLTENRTLIHCLQVANGIRQARPAINVLPVDDKGDIETAKIFKGIIRNIEVQSSASDAYDTAAWNAITATKGWIRVNTQYCDNESFDQECRILRIPDHRRVMLDPFSKEMDGSDAEFGFVFEDMSIEAFERRYPDRTPPTDFSENAKAKGWCTDESVRIAEYYYKTYTTKTLALTPSGIMEKSEAEAAGLEITQTRDVDVPAVKYCKIDGAGCFDETDWLGIYIPLVPVYGMEAWIDGKRHSFSLVHQAKDPQKRFNFWLTASTEIIALQPRVPFIGITGQFDTDASKWANANRRNFAFIQYDPVILEDGSNYVIPPQRQAVPEGSQTMFRELMAAADGIKAVVGVFDASLGNIGNETSGRAIQARQGQGDNATFHFPDNLQKSIAQVGRILIDLIPKIYTGQRVMRILGDDDAESFVPLNQGVVQDKGNYRPVQPGERPQAFFDLSTGKYDVVAAVGASFATKRMETVDTLKTIIQAAPETFSIFGDILFKSMDIPYSDVMAERLRRMNPVMQDDEDPAHAQMMQAQGLIQQLQATIQGMQAALDDKSAKESAEIEIKKGELELKNKELAIKAAEVAAKVQQMQAQNGAVTGEVMAEIIRTIASLESSVRDTAEAVNTILDAAGGQDTGTMAPAQEPLPNLGGNP